MALLCLGLLKRGLSSTVDEALTLGDGLLWSRLVG